MENSNKNSETKKVLLVEDDLDALEVCKTFLEDEDFKVLPARDGETALSLLKTEKFDMVILDIILPKTDGFSVFKSIRSGEATGNLPILVVSGRTGMADTFISCGADGFLPKPVEKETLIQEVKEIVKPKALLMADSHSLVEKITKIFSKQGYAVTTVTDETELIKTGKSRKYKCVVAHLSKINSEPKKFQETVSGFLNHKDPTLVIYSDSSVKGLETSNTVAIEAEITKWTRAGVKNFYDSRVSLRPLSALLMEWLPS
jgi:DNA-binding response OmpR family regulator